MRKLVLLLSIVFFISLVPAPFEFDNTGSYDEDSRTITIKNAFGLGRDIATITLDTPTHVNVFPGRNRKVAEFTIQGLENYTEVFNALEFYDMNEGGRGLSQPFTYKFKSTESYDKLNYETTCSTNSTGYEECLTIKKGTIRATRDVWNNFDESLGITKGNITIGIFADVRNGDFVDWIPTFFGVRIPQWATWGATLGNGIKVFYTFNETSGFNIFDSTKAVPNMNGTMINMEEADHVAGFIGNALNFSGANTIEAVTSANNIDVFSAQDRSIFAWVNMTPNSFQGAIASWGNNANKEEVSLAIQPDNSLRAELFGADVQSSAKILDNDWTFVGLTMEDEGGGNTNISLYINTTRVASVLVSGINTANTKLHVGNSSVDLTWEFHGFIDEIGVWNRTLTQLEIEELYNSGDGLTFGDGPDGTILTTLNSPPDGITLRNGTSQIFNATLLPAGPLTLTNATITIFNSSSDIVNQTTIIVTGTAINESIFNITIPQVGTGFLWNVLGCGDFAGSAVCSLANSNFTYNSVTFTENSQDFNATTFETAKETFTLNLTLATGAETPTVQFFYNGTLAGNATSVADEFINIFTIPLIETATTNNTFFWEITSGTSKANTTLGSHLVDPINFTFSGFGTATPVYLNITFKNETLGEEDITAQIVSTFNFRLSNGTQTKSFSFTDLTENSNYNFSFTPQDRSVQVNTSIIYDNVGSQQRQITKAFNLTNASTTQTLFLLPTSEGVFVTFQVVDVAEAVIEGVAVNVSRLGNLVESGVTDGAGIIVFFLDPDLTYVLGFSKEGFPVTIITIKPTQSSFTITLGQATTVSNFDFNKGISYDIRPLRTIPLKNETTTEFNVTLVSTFNTVTEFGFTLTNGSGSFLDSTSVSANGGFASATINTGSETRIVLDFFYVITGNTTRLNITYFVTDGTGTGFGLANFFSNLSLFASQGIFGLDDFSLTLIIFFIIFLFTGIMSFRFGLNNPTVIVLIVFFQVLLFDVIFGLIPAAPGVSANLHLPVVISGLALLGMIVRDFTR